MPTNPNEIPIIFTSTGSEKAVSDADRVGAALTGVSNKFASFERAGEASSLVMDKIQKKIFSSIRAGGRALTTGLIANIATGKGMMSTWDQIKSLANPTVFGLGIGDQLAGSAMDKWTKGLRNLPGLKGFGAGMLRTGLSVGARAVGQLGGAAIGGAVGSAAGPVGSAIGAVVGGALSWAVENTIGKAYRGVRVLFNPMWGNGYTEQDVDIMNRGKDTAASWLKYGPMKGRKFADASFWPETSEFSNNKFATPEGYNPETDIFRDNEVLLKGDEQTLGYDRVSHAIRLINKVRERQLNASGQVGF